MATASRGGTATTTTVPGNGTGEFLYTNPKNVAIQQQVRSDVDQESESFTALVESIKARGILEPLLVAPADGSTYQLLCGERRFLAARKAGVSSIPVRVMNAVTQQDEILAHQLTENLLREDLNPIDQAQGIMAYLQARMPGRTYEVDGVLNDLVSYNRGSQYCSEGFSTTVVEIARIAGKSITSLHRSLSLLKLPDAVRIAVYEGTLPVSQGYLFAANLDCPDLMTIFEDIRKKPVTNLVLEKLLTAWKKEKPNRSPAKPVTRHLASMKAWKASISKANGDYTKEDLEKLRDELAAMLEFVRQRAAAG